VRLKIGDMEAEGAAQSLVRGLVPVRPARTGSFIAIELDADDAYFTFDGVRAVGHDLIWMLETIGEDVDALRGPNRRGNSRWIFTVIGARSAHGPGEAQEPGRAFVRYRGASSTRLCPGRLAGSLGPTAPPRRVAKAFLSAARDPATSWTPPEAVRLRCILEFQILSRLARSTE
jgi:hypothetical protein